jgi:uncharacterized protein (DUF1778 family)
MMRLEERFMSSVTSKQARLDFPASSEIKALIEQAAAALGQSVSEFARVTLIARSHEVLANSETNVLSTRDRDRFLALLDAPPEPNEALVDAAAEYRAAVNRKTLFY